jgi:basic membrane protein A
MSREPKLTRRQVLVNSANLVAASSAVGMLPSLAAAAGKPLKVGFIYVATRHDLGWNQSHSEAADAIAKLPDTKVVEQENVPETAEVEKVMEGMIRLDGVDVLFPTSFGYWPHIVKIASKYPNVLFVHAGGRWEKGDPKNTIGYRGFMEEPHYLCGMAAGLMTKTGKIGFIGAKPLYFIFNNVNGYTLGARAVRPGTVCHFVITGEWDNPVKEAEATNSMIDQGVDVVICNTDSPKVSMETTARRGVFCCGYNIDLSAVVPKSFLTGAEYRWAKGVDFVQAWRNGTAYPNLLRGGFNVGMVKLSPFGAIVPDAAKKRILDVRDQLTADKYPLYRGPIRDNKENTVVPAGRIVPNSDNDFKVKMEFLVEGTIGETGLKKS